MNWPCGKVAIERRPAGHSRPGVECFGQKTPQRPRAARDCGLGCDLGLRDIALRNWTENSYRQMAGDGSAHAGVARTRRVEDRPVEGDRRCHRATSWAA